MGNVLFEVCSVYCVVYSIKCVVFAVHGVLCSVQCSTAFCGYVQTILEVHNLQWMCTSYVV